MRHGLSRWTRHRTGRIFTSLAPSRQTPWYTAYIRQFRIISRYLSWKLIQDCLFIPGWLNSAEDLIIHEELRPTFHVAVGLRGASEEEWTDYRGMFSRAVRHPRDTETARIQRLANFASIHLISICIMLNVRN